VLTPDYYNHRTQVLKPTARDVQSLVDSRHEPPRQKLANWLGFVSLVLSVLPVLYVFYADSFPHNALTDVIVYADSAGRYLQRCLPG